MLILSKHRRRAINPTLSHTSFHSSVIYQSDHSPEPVLISLQCQFISSPPLIINSKLPSRASPKSIERQAFDGHLCVTKILFSLDEVRKERSS